MQHAYHNIKHLLVQPTSITMCLSNYGYSRIEQRKSREREKAKEKEKKNTENNVLN